MPHFKIDVIIRAGIKINHLSKRGFLCTFLMRLYVARDLYVYVQRSMTIKLGISINILHLQTVYLSKHAMIESYFIGIIFLKCKSFQSTLWATVFVKYLWCLLPQWGSVWPYDRRIFALSLATICLGNTCWDLNGIHTPYNNLSTYI